MVELLFRKKSKSIDEEEEQGPKAWEQTNDWSNPFSEDPSVVSSRHDKQEEDEQKG
jgi:hypothetical protein